MKCLTDDQNVQYCDVDGEWHVGTNYSSAYTEKTAAIITIPKQIEGHDIKYIGSYAFDRDTNLYSVTIKADIIAFKTHAFGNCPNLVYINIPSTVETIGSNAIQCYNSNEQLRKGTLVVSFDFNPRLKSIGRQVFSFKEFTHIYLCEKISPEIDPTLFTSTKATVFAPTSFSFQSIETTLTSTCMPNQHKQISCYRIHRPNSNLFISLFIILV